MDLVHEITLLLDFYGQLLTERQYEILDLHYNNDYSLGEIAEQLNISRQGVFDNIKRGKAVLNNYEQKLGLVVRFSQQKKRVKEILESIKSIDTSCFSDEDKSKFQGIETGIINMMDDF